MKPLTHSEIEDLLTPQETPRPPEGLAEKIKNDVPDPFTALTTPAANNDNVVVGSFGAWRPQRWLLAASLVMAVGGGLMAYRLMQEVPRPELGRLAARSEAPAATARPADQVHRRLAATAEPETESAPAAEVKSQVAAEPPAAAPSPVQDGRWPAVGAQKEGAEAVPPPVGNEVDRAAQEHKAPQEHQAPMSMRMERETLRQELEALSQRLKSMAGETSDAVGDDGGRQPAAPPPAPAGPIAEESRVLPDASTRFGEVAVAPAAAAPAAAGHDHEGRYAARRREKARTEESLERRLGGVVSTGGEVGQPAPSTGGTTEPNDAPYGDVFFRGYGTNPFIDTEDDRLSTFGLDVDTGSYTVVRRYLRDGHLPPPDAVRVEEFVNYFDYGDPAPRQDDFAIHAEGAPSPFGEGERYYLLRFNLHGREISDHQRRPAILTFVVDVSGSMGRENRLGLVKEALFMLLDQLRRDDAIALVVYGTQGRVLLEHTNDHYRIRRAIGELRPEGSTNAEEGLRLGYELAARQWRRGTINRVILCSDGVANVGRTSADSILSQIRRHAERGIELTAVGFGMGNYNDVLMEQLADTGNGRYAYVDHRDEARRIFVESLTGTLQTIAIEARVQVDFNPDVVARYRLLGYENRDLADQRFRDDSVDAGEIGAGHTVTALYELKLHHKPRRRDQIATLHLRYGSLRQARMTEMSRTVTGAEIASRWEQASPALRLTSLVAEFGEILKESYWARSGDLREVLRRLERVADEYRGDPEVADFVDLVARAAGRPPGADEYDE